MKRLIAIALVVALAVTALAVAIPVFATPDGNPVVYENNILDIPDFPDELTGGESCVRANGDVKVEITGANVGRDYGVWFSYGPEFDTRFSFLGFMTEYDDGDYKLETNLSNGNPEVPPNPFFPRFFITRWDGPQFADGFWWE